MIQNLRLDIKKVTQSGTEVYTKLNRAKILKNLDIGYKFRGAN